MKILDRNRRMRKIAEKAAYKRDRATIHSLDGDRANIRLGNASTVIHNVEIVGDGSSLVPGQVVPILWKDNRPVVVPSGVMALASSTAKVDNLGYPAVKVWSSLAQSFANNTDVAIAFDTLLIDTGGYWNSDEPDRATIWEDGLYLIAGHLWWNNLATGVRMCKIRVNEVDVSRISFPGIAGGVTGGPDTVLARLARGDFIQLVGYQNSGGAVSNVVLDSASPSLTLIQLGG